MKLDLAERLKALLEILKDNGYSCTLEVRDNKTILTITMGDFREAMGVAKLYAELRDEKGNNRQTTKSTARKPAGNSGRRKPHSMPSPARNPRPYPGGD